MTFLTNRVRAGFSKALRLNSICSLGGSLERGARAGRAGSVSLKEVQKASDLALDQSKAGEEVAGANNSWVWLEGERVGGGLGFEGWVSGHSLREGDGEVLQPQHLTTQRTEAVFPGGQVCRGGTIALNDSPKDVSSAS